MRPMLTYDPRTERIVIGRFMPPSHAVAEAMPALLSRRFGEALLRADGRRTLFSTCTCSLAIYAVDAIVAG